jgi:hypothetical protein
MRVFWTGFLILIICLPVLGQDSNTTKTNGVKPKKNLAMNI